MALTTVDAGLLGTQAQYTGFKNRIINGLMGISQRGTSFATPTTGTYSLDRWITFWGGAAPASIAQVAGPSGFRNALQITGAASNTYVQLNQRIESYNCSDLSGSSITIQANIAVSSSQTVAWYLFYANAQDNFSATTQIATGTWSATSTATTFTATVASLPSGATNGLALLIAPNNNGAFTSGTFTITGVQLEKGSTATSFDYRPYGTELALCQRYFWNFTNSSTYYPIMQAYATGSVAGLFVSFPVQMRTAPTATFSGTLVPLSSSGTPQAGISGITWGTTTTTAQISGSSGSSGLVAGNAVILSTAIGSSLQLSSEL